MKPQHPGVKSYKQAVEERTAARKVTQHFPDLAAADSLYNPKRGVMTLEQMGDAQRSIGDDKPRLSDTTLEGLKAIVDATNAAKGRDMTDKPAETKVETTPEAPPAKAEVAPAQSTDPLEDFDYEAGWRQTQYDILNNAEEREAVRKLVEPIDIDAGLTNNEFTQVVPIGPIKVEFRTLRPMEYSTMRSMIFKMIDDGRVRDAISSEIHSLMMTVASVKAFNGKELPEHVVPDKGYYKFDEEVFMSKVRKFEAYPAPVMHALGCHSAWFDLRCREFFRNGTALKNG